MYFNVGSVYSFNTMAPAILTGSYRNVKILGILDYSMAWSYINIDIMQKSVYPLLPVGTPDNPRDYLYVLFMTEGNVKTVLAIPWIDVNSIVETKSVDLYIQIRKANLEDIVKIRDTLRLIGYSDMTINTG